MFAETVNDLCTHTIVLGKVPCMTQSSSDLTLRTGPLVSKSSEENCSQHFPQSELDKNNFDYFFFFKEKQFLLDVKVGVPQGNQI